MYCVASTTCSIATNVITSHPSQSINMIMTLSELWWFGQDGIDQLEPKFCVWIQFFARSHSCSKLSTRFVVVVNNGHCSVCRCWAFSNLSFPSRTACKSITHPTHTLQDLELWFSRIVSCPSPLGKHVRLRSIYLCFYRGLKPQTQLPPWPLEIQNELKIDNSCLIPLEFSLVFCLRPL